jgi:hypothetical protein
MIVHHNFLFVVTSNSALKINGTKSGVRVCYTDNLFKTSGVHENISIQH